MHQAAIRMNSAVVVAVTSCPLANAKRHLLLCRHAQMPTILHAESGPLLSAARELFAEYALSIASVAACSLQHQGFDAELAALPGKYAPPRGCILVARQDAVQSAKSSGLNSQCPVPNAQSPVPSVFAGCIALRPLPELGPDVGELKRMYVRPAYRGTGLGRRLGEHVIAFARAAGYTTMKLDTSTSMHAAIGLYRSLGFVECARYNDDPMGDTLWFELRL